MKHLYPSYYSEFRCIASRCPDSCCKDWDVVVDSETEAFYNTVQGEPGDKLRRLTVTDSDGDRVFVLQDGKCPFWNRDMLCDLYTQLGEEHLCRTCRNFPRITADYTLFAEHTLSFACPEAARLILNADNAYAAFDEIPDDLTCEDYDGELMRALLSARRNTAALLRDRSQPFAQRLAEALRYNAEVQALLTDSEPETLDGEPQRDIDFLFDFFSTLDYMHEENKRLLLCGKGAALSQSSSASHDELFEKLSLYSLYRYYLNAIGDGDVLGCVLRMVCAFLLISAALRADPTLDPCAVMQKYSKEIEHSYENNEELDFAFAADPHFSANNLIGVLVSS